MKKLTALILSLILMLAVTACGNSPDAANGSGNTGSTENADNTAPDAGTGGESETSQLSNGGADALGYKIGWSTDILSSNFTSGLAAAFQAQCDALGIELEIQDANRDMNLQITQVENMIANGCQAIVLKPYDMSACQPISTACREAEVPLIIICSDITSDYDCAVLVDSKTLGALKAQAIVDALGGEGSVAFIHGTLSQQGWAEQADAAKELFAQYPGITIADEQVAENNDQALAISVAENWVTAGLEMDAIWCSQDTVAIGAGTALGEADIEDVYIIGQGGEEDAQIAVRSGLISATVYLPSSVYVDGAMEAVVALLGGGTIDKDLYMELQVMTAQNIDTLIA